MMKYLLAFILMFTGLQANAWNLTNGSVSVTNVRLMQVNGATLTGNSANGTALLEFIGNDGTVTSVDISGSNGIVATGGPITDNGTINVTLNQGSVLVPSAIGTTVQAYSSNLDTLATNDGSGLTGLVLASTDLTDTTNIARLNAAQTFTNNNTFSTTGSSTTVTITHASGSGIALDISKGGNNEGLRVTKTSGSGNAVTIAGGDLGTNSNINMSGETASTIAHFDASKNIKSLATSTYPSLTELSYVKGVTSAIQTQLNAKGVGDALTTNPLSQFAATTSSQLAGVISDETGSGALVFGTSPTINGATLTNTTTANGGVAFQKQAYFDEEVDDGNSGASDTIDWTTGNKHKSTLTDDCTYTFTAPTGPTNIVLRIIQDGTGGRTITWPSSTRWPGGTAPTLTAAANSIDIVSCYWNGTNYFCVASLDFQAL